MRRSQYDPFGTTPRMRRRRWKLLMLVGALVLVAAALVGTTVFLLPRMGTHAAATTPNQNCTLIVPDQPLTAQGLATPIS